MTTLGLYIRIPEEFWPAGGSLSKVCVEGRMRGGRTVGPLLVLKPAAVASQPTIRDISCTNAFVSRAFAVLARNWESLAWRQGCVER
jgi:hypothetical protein